MLCIHIEDKRLILLQICNIGRPQGEHPFTEETGGFQKKKFENLNSVDINHINHSVFIITLKINPGTSWLCPLFCVVLNPFSISYQVNRVNNIYSSWEVDLLRLIFEGMETLLNIDTLILNLSSIVLISM